MASFCYIHMYLYFLYSRMKTTKIIYRVSTIALVLFILPGIFYINSPMAIEGLNHLWPFPERFRFETSIASFIGGLILILPLNCRRIKEWAYVGLGITYISAFVGHMTVDGFVFMTLTPIIALAVLLISYVTYHKIYAMKKVK